MWVWVMVSKASWMRALINDSSPVHTFSKSSRPSIPISTTIVAIRWTETRPVGGEVAGTEGPMDGALEGMLLGTVDGFLLGALLGGRLGARLVASIAEGPTDGALDGLLLGTIVGFILRALLGARLGASIAEGPTDAVLEGLLLGTVLGFLLGALLGARLVVELGAILGAIVGNPVKTTSTFASLFTNEVKEMIRVSPNLPLKPEIANACPEDRVACAMDTLESTDVSFDTTKTLLLPSWV